MKEMAAIIRKQFLIDATPIPLTIRTTKITLTLLGIDPLITYTTLQRNGRRNGCARDMNSKHYWLMVYISVLSVYLVHQSSPFALYVALLLRTLYHCIPFLLNVIFNIGCGQQQSVKGKRLIVIPKSMLC